MINFNEDIKTLQKKNCFIYHKANTRDHELLKCAVFMWAIDMGYDVITECRFKNGKRADVVIFPTGMSPFVVEIETNQDPKNIEKKKKDYAFEWVDYVAVIDPSKPFNEKDFL